MRCSSEGESTVPGADGVAADALADEIRGDRLGEADHGRLARAVDIAVRDAADRGRARRDVDDRARFPALGRALQHARQEGADRAVHRLDVEVEGKIPVLLGAFEHRAVMHEAGAVEEHVDLADRGRELLHRRRVEHVRALRSRADLQPVELRRVDVGGDHLRALRARTPPPWRGRSPAPPPSGMRAYLPTVPFRLLFPVPPSPMISSGQACPVSTSTVA